MERLTWRVATVTGVVDETSHARTLVLDVDGWPGHVAGQHADVRLTAEDGYEAQRSYSIASAPEDPTVSLTIERIDDGEVSPYLAGEARDGDRFELRGPIGGHFSWRAQQGGPPLLVSSRTEEDILYRAELDRLDGGELAVHHTLTRGTPEGWRGFDGRVDAEMLRAVGPAVADAPRVFVCGPTPFVEAVADLLVGLGHEPASIHAERFGPTGG